jgi:hypothetical protein
MISTSFNASTERIVFSHYCIKKKQPATPIPSMAAVQEALLHLSMKVDPELLN